MANLQQCNSVKDLETLTSEVTLVDFWAEWCGPCRQMIPRLEELVTQKMGNAIGVDMDKPFGMEIARAIGISSIPTMLIVKNGQLYVGKDEKGEPKFRPLFDEKGNLIMGKSYRESEFSYFVGATDVKLIEQRMNEAKGLKSIM